MSPEFDFNFIFISFYYAFLLVSMIPTLRRVEYKTLEFFIYCPVVQNIQNSKKSMMVTIPDCLILTEIDSSEKKRQL